MNVSSKITQVTVYADRAEITRSIHEHLPAGEHALVFDGLPGAIEENSLQVKGRQGALLKDTRLRRVYFAEFPEAQVKEAHDALERLKAALAEVDDRLSSCEKETKLLEGIAKKLTTPPPRKSEAFEYDPKSWTDVIDFYRSRSDAVNRETREAKRARASLADQIEKAERELRRIDSGNRKVKTQIEVTVVLAREADLALDLCYMIHGPSWQPVYDLRVSSEGKRLKLSYHAMVRQRSAESWDGVSLKLSTARPEIGGDQPALTPWRVAFSVPEPPAMLRSRALPAGAPMAAAAPAAMKQMFEAEEAERGAPMEAAGATVEAGATSVAFVVEGASTIGCDGEPHRVTVLEREFPATFRYSAVPKLSPYAYLKAKTRNETEYPFLPGASNVFLDGNFVARASLALVAPGEEYWTFLGIDESLKITHKYLGRFEMTEGLFAKSTKLMYKYLLTARNTKKTAEELVIWDQLPISGNEELVVKLVEPEYRKDTDALKISELKYVEWLLELQPGQEAKLPFTFTVEYPRGSTVDGL